MINWQFSWPNFNLIYLLQNMPINVFCKILLQNAGHCIYFTVNFSPRSPDILKTAAEGSIPAEHNRLFCHEPTFPPTPSYLSPLSGVPAGLVLPRGTIPAASSDPPGFSSTGFLPSFGFTQEQVSKQILFY